MSADDCERHACRIAADAYAASQEAECQRLREGIQALAAEWERLAVEEVEQDLGLRREHSNRWPYVTALRALLGGVA